jgi:hypothetical protein
VTFARDASTESLIQVKEQSYQETQQNHQTHRDEFYLAIQRSQEWFKYVIM